MSAFKFIEGFIAGLATGFTIGVLTAPKSGRELRHDIASAGVDLCKQAETSTDAVIHELEQRRDELTKSAKAIIDELDSSVQELKSQSEAMRELISRKSKEAAEETKAILAGQSPEGAAMR